MAALADGGKSETLAAQAGEPAEGMRGILAEHRALWLARNRPGGLEQGSADRLRGMIDIYRQLRERLSP
jgi:hypothetical protein